VWQRSGAGREGGLMHLYPSRTGIVFIWRGLAWLIGGVVSYGLVSYGVVAKWR